MCGTFVSSAGFVWDHAAVGTVRLHRWLAVLMLLIPSLALSQSEDRETYENAVRVLTADLETNPSDAEAWFGLSIAHMHLAQFENALDATLRAAALDPADPRFVDQAGEAYMSMGRTEEAIEAFERAVDIDPRMFFPRLRLGELYIATGRSVSAIQHLEEAILLSGRDASARRFLGMAYSMDGQLDRAIAEYERAILLAPGEELLYLEAADVFFSASMEDEARSLLSQAVKLFPESGEAHLGLARLHTDAGRLREALDEFQLAIDSGQTLPFGTVYKTMGDIHFDLLEFEEALSYYDRALALNPEDTEALLAKGDLFLSRNDLQGATAAYSETTQIDPGNVEGHHGLAEIALRQGDVQEALRTAERVLELDPSFMESTYIRGQALIRLGRVAEGRRDIEKFREAQATDLAEEQQARDIQARNREALTLLEEGRMEEAIALLKTAIELYPDERLLYMNLAVAQSRSRLHQEAIRTYLEVIERGLADALTHLRLSREYGLLGNEEGRQRHRTTYLQMREQEPVSP